MGVFPLKNPPPPSQVASVNMISMSSDNLIKGKSIVDSLPLSPSEDIYQIIQSTSVDPSINDHLVVASDPYHFPYLSDSPHPYLDYILQTQPSDKSIMEVMSLD